jgi:hypothetical protein
MPNFMKQRKVQMPQNRQHRFIFSVILLFVVFAGLTAFAQTVISGDLTGTITDPQGAVVADAKVILKSLATGTTNNATTNKSGVYRFSLLKPGDYQLVVEQAGFKKLEVEYVGFLQLAFVGGLIRVGAEGLIDGAGRGGHTA